MNNSFFIVTKQSLDYLFSNELEKYELVKQIQLFLVWRKNIMCGNKAYILNFEWDKFEKEWEGHRDGKEIIAQAKSFVIKQDLFTEESKDLKQNMILLAKNLSAFGKVRILDNVLAEDNDFDIKIGKESRVHTIERGYDLIKSRFQEMLNKRNQIKEIFNNNTLMQGVSPYEALLCTNFISLQYEASLLNDALNTKGLFLREIKNKPRWLTFYKYCFLNTIKDFN